MCLPKYRASPRAVRLLVIGTGLLPARQELVHARFHFTRGLVGEGDGEDVARRDATFDEVRNAEGDHARLARAGARENEDGAFDGLDGLPLLGVEGTKIQHRARSLTAGRSCLKGLGHKVAGGEAPKRRARCGLI